MKVGEQNTACSGKAASTSSRVGTMRPRVNGEDVAARSLQWQLYPSV